MIMNRTEAVNSLLKFSKGERKSAAQDIKKLANLVKKGEYKKADKFWQSLDTFMRDGIPSEVLTFIRLNSTTKRKYISASISLSGEYLSDLALKDKIIFKGTWEFPGDLKDEEIARSIVFSEDEIRRKIINIKYSDVETKRVKQDE